MRMQDVMREDPDGGAGGGTNTQGAGAAQSGAAGGSGVADADYYRAEAKKAFAARDEFKAKLRQLEESGRVLSDEQLEKYRTLEETAAKAEEERKRKAGEFDSLRVQLTQKHETELKARDEKITHLSQRFKDTVVKAEFGAASDLFGGETAKTILDVELGMAALGKYVRVEDADDDPRGYRVVVAGPNGQPIVGRDGNPAPFADAMGELIASLPNKDRILRGSGKTGSGSSGGSRSADQGADVDVRRPLTPAELRDPAVRAKLKQQMANAGGLQVAAGLNRR